MSVTFDECAVRVMSKKLILSSNSGDTGTKKCNRVNNGVWRSQNGNRGTEKDIVANVRRAFNTKKFHSRHL
jgi:hypothetical protein